MLADYLTQAQERFKQRGTAYMVQVLDEIIESNITLEQSIDQCQQSRDQHARYSIEFQYYWSVLTYLKSLQDCYTAASN